MEKVTEHRRHQVDPKLSPRADASARPERQQPEIVTLHINILFEEPLWSELVRVFPNFRVTGHSPHVYVDIGSFRDIVPANLDVGISLVGKHQWGWRV
ncbi:hypothetical protein RHGRI_009936 [Rhododendron griersonianum]|uniref:Uncharacterized protein n=1 Tax=Rhododendron griersonianum TaxID=479676 RepID=A0AAV6KGL9_9ERIC|nr:hypothetical protein RHGRI_009936 [Rhododendron griersonianum]